MAGRLKEHWNKDFLRHAVEKSTSIRQTLNRLGLREAGGNYQSCSKYISLYSLDVSHFTGKGWSKNKSVPRQPVFKLDELLVKNRFFQSNKLKKRLFAAGIKSPQCEECGWAQKSTDGRIPVELDHINGDSTDNRIVNLRILCPNCHSLKLTHRGSNIRLRRRGGEIGQTRSA